jgi:hypothetical protein
MVEQAARATSVPVPAAPVRLMTAMGAAAMFVVAVFVAKIAVVEGSPAMVPAVAVVVPVRIVVAEAPVV